MGWCGGVGIMGWCGGVGIMGWCGGVRIMGWCGGGNLITGYSALACAHSFPSCMTS